MGAEAMVNYVGLFAAVFLLVLGWALARDLLWRTPRHPGEVIVPGYHHRILLPVSSPVSAERQIDLAAHLPRNVAPDVLLLHVIEVPLTLPLETSLPSREAAAQALIRHGEALSGAHGMQTFSEIKRGRVASKEIVDAAKEWGADLIIISVEPREKIHSVLFGRTSERVRHDAPCEVLLESFPHQAHKTEAWAA
jgi:nucleotide-binding universal stress UspA family protein